MSVTLPLARRAAACSIALLVATATPALSAPKASNAPARSAVVAPPVGDSDFGPVADWGTKTGTDGRVYMADANGRALQLHGFNLKTTDPSAALTDDLLAAAAERGLDHYRMTIYWQFLEPTQGNYDEAYLDNIVTAIRRSEAHGIRVILDMHQDVFGEAFDSHGVPAWATRTDGLPFEPQASWLLDYLQPAVQAAFDHLYEDADLRQAQIDSWLAVVERVKDEPGLLGYDLMNEPFGQIREGETLLSAAERVERVQLTAMYQRITDAIAQVDPDHWVFIEPPNLASLGIPTSLGRVNGPKVALYPHMYDVSLESQTYDPNSTEYTYDPAFFDKWAAAITTYVDKYPMPMLVGEWGAARPEAHSMDAYFRESLATMDRVASGWSIFVFCKGDGYCALDAAGNDRPNIGQIFVPYARAIAGAPTSSRFDFTSKVLKVVFAAEDMAAPTEIFIPESRSYPGGFVVETSAPDGTWSQSFDEATGVLSVSFDATQGAQAICVRPTDGPAGCTVADAALPDAPAAPGGPVAPPATPVVTRPTYTG